MTGQQLDEMNDKVEDIEHEQFGFELFYTGYGIAWFLGSVAMGLLYGKSILAVVIFSVVLQLLALPVFFLARRRSENAASS